MSIVEETQGANKGMRGFNFNGKSPLGGIDIARVRFGASQIETPVI